MWQKEGVTNNLHTSVKQFNPEQDLCIPFRGCCLENGLVSVEEPGWVICEPSGLSLLGWSWKFLRSFGMWVGAIEAEQRNIMHGDDFLVYSAVRGQGSLLDGSQPCANVCV